MPAIPRRRLLAASAAAPLGLTLSGLSRGGSASERIRKSNVAKLDAIGALLRRLTHKGRIAGASARVSLNGEPLYEVHHGVADMASGRAITPDTIYRIYSMSKPVTAAAIMILVDDGKLALTDPVARYVPEFANLAVYVGEEKGEIHTEPAKLMRVVDLLTHTSGISNSWNEGPVAPIYRSLGLHSGRLLHDPHINGLPDVAARISKAPLQFQPGSQWLYSVSPDIAGLVVERVAGTSFGDFLKTRLFEPLGMNDTGFHVPQSKAERLASMYAMSSGQLVLTEEAAGSPFLKPPSIESGSAGLLSTLGDYSRFASMLSNLGELKGVRVLSQQSARTMMSNHVDPKVLGQSLLRFMAFGAGGSGQGMGVALCGAVMLEPAKSQGAGHKGDYAWGGAASTTFFAAPELGLDAVLMTQLFPSGSLPLLDWLKTAVYNAMQ